MTNDDDDSGKNICLKDSVICCFKCDKPIDFIDKSFFKQYNGE